jgi:AcrR family transcriptional regulator
MRNSQEGNWRVVRRRGRPVGESGTREAIVEAARRQFGDLGYQRTTLRGVAERAGVDPRLVLHYFGSKAGLFQASVALPIDPAVVLGRIFDAPTGDVPRRAAEVLVGILDDPESRRGFLAVLRAAVAEPQAALSIRQVLSDRLLGPISARVGGDQPETRAGLLSTLLVGLAVGRHIVGFPSLTSLSREALVEALVPVIRHYLYAPLHAPEDR